MPSGLLRAYTALRVRAELRRLSLYSRSALHGRFLDVDFLLLLGHPSKIFLLRGCCTLKYPSPSRAFFVEFYLLVNCIRLDRKVVSSFLLASAEVAPGQWAKDSTRICSSLDLFSSS